MDVHSRSVDAENRLRHERRVEAMVERDLLDDETERRDAIGGRDRVRVLEVDLVLPGRDLVMRGFDLEAHLLERDDDVPARLLASIDRGEIEIGAFVVGIDDRVSIRVAAEKEELGFRPRHHRVAERGGLVHLLLEREAGASAERRAIRVVDVADQAADFFPVVGPGIDGKGVQIRNQVHVRFLDPREPFDRRPVELDLAVERFRKLRARNLDVLDDPEDVGELQPHEPHVFLLAHPQDLVLVQARSRRVEFQDPRSLDSLRHPVLLFSH